MNDKKDLMIVKESFFKRIIDKIKNSIRKILKKEKTIEEVKLQKKDNINNRLDKTNVKNAFFDYIRVGYDSEILYLKIKLESGEIKAIDLTDEQIDELQKIYDKEIEEKKNKIIKLKNVA